MNTIAIKNSKITLTEAQAMERELKKIYAQSGSFSEQTQKAIFEAMYLVRKESDGLALEQILCIINRNINTH